MSETEQTEQQTAPEKQVEVVLLSKSVKACGKYLPNTVYSVGQKEGERLVKSKGFVKATNAVKQKLAEAEKKAEAAKTDSK